MIVIAGRSPRQCGCTRAPSRRLNGYAACSNNTASDDTPPTLVAAGFAGPQTIRLTFSEPVADPSAVNTDAFRLSIGVKDVASTVYYALDYDGLEPDPDTGDDPGPISDADPTADPTIVDPTDATGDGSTGDPTADPTDPTGGTYDPSDSYDPTNDPTEDPSGYEGEGGYSHPGTALPGDLTRPIPTIPIADLDIAAVSLGSDKKQIDLQLAVPVTDTFACDALAELAAESTKLGIFVHYKPGSKPLTDAAGNSLAAIAPHWVDARANAYAELQGDFPHLNPYLPIACP